MKSVETWRYASGGPHGDKVWGYSGKLSDLFTRTRVVSEKAPQCVKNAMGSPDWTKGVVFHSLFQSRIS